MCVHKTSKSECSISCNRLKRMEFFMYMQTPPWIPRLRSRLTRWYSNKVAWVSQTDSHSQVSVMKPKSKLCAEVKIRSSSSLGTRDMTLVSIIFWTNSVLGEWVLVIGILTRLLRFRVRIGLSRPKCCLPDLPIPCTIEMFWKGVSAIIQGLSSSHCGLSLFSSELYSCHDLLVAMVCK
jgi:hypothetical protein